MTNEEILEKFIKVEMDMKSNCTKITYKNGINKFFDFIGNRSMLDLKRVDIKEFLNYLSSNYSTSTVNVVMTATTRLYDFVVYDLELMTKNVAFGLNRPKIENEKEETISDEQFEDMISHSKNIRDKIILNLLGIVGLRVSEMINIELEDFNGSELTVLGKGNKLRTIYLSDTVVDLIEEYINTKRKSNGCTRLITSDTAMPMRRESISRTLKVIASRCETFTKEEANNIHPHALRHYGATRLHDKNVDIETISKILGHSNVAITSKIYVAPRKDKIKEAMTMV